MKRTKLISSVSWATASCALLWLFSLAQPQNLSSPPRAVELFDSFLHFSFMLLGGGLSYHFLSEIFATPHTQTNERGWWSLTVNLFWLMLALISIPVGLILIRESFMAGVAYLMALGYMLLLFLVSAWLASRVEKQFLRIRSSGELKSDNAASGESDA